MLTLLSKLSTEFLLECNSEAFKTGGSSVLPLADLDDLFFCYCAAPFVKEI